MIFTPIAKQKMQECKKPIGNSEKNNGTINLVEWKFYHLYRIPQAYSTDSPRIVNLLLLLLLGEAHEGNRQITYPTLLT